MLVHEDNFLFKGVWGVNWSYQHYKYSLQLVRWDKDSKANSFGTLYHEQMHSVDAVIEKELGKNIDPLFNGDWDKYVVHGGRPDEEGKFSWDYIRYQENTDALILVKDDLKKAYQVRKEKHNKVLIKLMNRIIYLATALINLRNK